MRKRRYSLTVRGKFHEWSFPLWADPRDVKSWRYDGLAVEEVLNVIPQWVDTLGLAGLWIWVHDLLRGR